MRSVNNQSLQENSAIKLNIVVSGIILLAHLAKQSSQIIFPIGTNLVICS